MLRLSWGLALKGTKMLLVVLVGLAIVYGTAVGAVFVTLNLALSDAGALAAILGGATYAAIGYMTLRSVGVALFSWLLPFEYLALRQAYEERLIKKALESEAELLNDNDDEEE